ncbi:MAG TPA: FtsW/RodA/SpoVE family cell cycle protein [Acidimicrobiales bacterium]|nr:FtsW/RodA/SpoVE family cell cycle protein [Acidimicrobiales bacterium]
MTTVGWSDSFSRSRTTSWASWRQFDVALAAVTVAVAVFGAVLLYYSTRVQLQAQGLSPTFYAKKQAIYLVIGVVVMMAVAAVDYRRYRDWAPVLFILTVLSLVAVFVLGRSSNGAEAWFQIGSYQLEPSEFAKPTLIVALAAFVATFKGRLPGRALGAALVLSAIPLALIYKEPALGSALVLAVVLVAMLALGGARPLHLGILAVVAVIGVGAVLNLGVLQKFQQDRITSFLSTPNQPNAKFLASKAGSSRYNDAYSKQAVSDGGLRGKGLGHGLMTNLGEVPSQQTDFIFSAIAEQVGLVGSAVLLMLFLVMTWRTWQAAILSRDQMGTLVCVGVLALMAFQVFENVGMAMGIMPVAGITLPFVSYGGSAMVAAFAAIGLVLNVRMHRFN